MKKHIFEPLVGKTTKIDRGGPNSRTGKLLAVSDDFLTLLTEDDGVIYYSMRHIKSVTENSKNKNQFPVEVPADFEYKMSDNFVHLLDSMKYQWVRINRGGPEKLEGVLHDCNEDFVVLVNNDEVIRLSTFHINNVSYGLKLEVPEKEDEKKEVEKKED